MAIDHGVTQEYSEREDVQNKDLLIKQLKSEIFQLRNVIDNLPGSIYWKDNNGVYLGRNKHSAQWMCEQGFEESVDADYVIGKTDYDFFDKDIADRFRENDQVVMQSQQKQVVEEELILPNDEVESLLSTKTPLYNEDGEVVGIIGNTVYITHLKKIEAQLRVAKEQAEAASRAKTEFIRNMEHDIRTPFSGVWIIAEQLCSEETDPQKKEYLNDIAVCAKELLDYCNSILDYSRIDLGLLPGTSVEMDVAKVIDKILKIEMPVAKQKELRLHADCDQRIPDVLIGDEFRLTRILLNLVSNAVKFTIVGSVKLSVKLKEISDDDVVQLQFIIEDTGIGILEDKLEYIYEKFTRLSTANSGAYKGTGLGLPIVKVLVDDLNGDIDVNSEINKGSCFIVTLPFELSKSAAK